MTRHILDEQIILLTGGTGSFGRAFIDQALAESTCTIRVFSRDEYKQSEIRDRHGDERVRSVPSATNDRILTVEELRATVP